MCVLILVLLCPETEVLYLTHIVLSYFTGITTVRLNISSVLHWAQYEDYIQENKNRGKNNVINVHSLTPCQSHDRLREAACSLPRSLMMSLGAQAIHTIMTQNETSFSPLRLKGKNWLSNHRQYCVTIAQDKKKRKGDPVKYAISLR